MPRNIYAHIAHTKAYFAYPPTYLSNLALASQTSIASSSGLSLLAGCRS